MTSIHPTAIIHPSAQIGEDCDIGPYCTIGEHVVLGRRCRLISHVVIDGYTTLGDDNEIYPFASLGLRTQDLKWKGGVTRTQIGDCNIIREDVSIHSATFDGNCTVVGSHNAFLASCHIAHDCVVGNHVVMANYAGLTGHVTVEDGAILGGLVGIHQFARVGRMSMTGGCSKVTQDAPPYMIVDGNPAETRGINKIGLDRKGVPEETQRALKRAFKFLCRDGLNTANALAKIEAELPPFPEVKHLVEFYRTSQRGVTN
jgi:UDP-N-acetylglucosamine acyltransferase